MSGGILSVSRPEHEAENERISSVQTTDHVEFHENTACQLDVFLLYVFDWDETGTDRQTDRQRERLTDRRLKDRDSVLFVCVWWKREWDRRRDRQTDGERDRGTDKQIDRQTDSDRQSVFFLYVFDGDKNSSEVSNVWEDLLFSCTEAADWLHVTRLSNTLRPWSLFTSISWFTSVS